MQRNIVDVAARWQTSHGKTKEKRSQVQGEFVVQIAVAG